MSPLIPSDTVRVDDHVQKEPGGDRIFWRGQIYAPVEAAGELKAALPRRLETATAEAPDVTGAEPPAEA